VEIRFSYEEKEIIAQIKGDIDHHYAKQLREEIDAELDESHPLLLIIDLSLVEFMDSSGLGLILGRYKKMNTWDGKVKVIGVKKQVSKVMSVGILSKYVEIEGERI